MIRHGYAATDARGDSGSSAVERSHAELEKRIEALERANRALLEQQEAMAQREQFLLMVTANLPGMVGYWDENLRCRFANPAYVEWFGVTPEALLGRTIMELLGPELFAKNEPYIRKALAGERQRFEREIRKPNGVLGHALADYIPHIVDGRVLGFVVLVNDIAELRHAQQERDEILRKMTEAQKIESLGVLAGGIAHDFNNLLTGIMANANLVGEDVVGNEEANASIALILESSRRAAELCQQLLAYSGRGKFVFRGLDVSSLVAATTKLVRAASASKSVEVSFALANDLPKVMMDPTQIRQVVMNLVLNASEAVPALGGRIAISTGRTVATASLLNDALIDGGLLGKDCVYVVVEDNGCGIAAQDLRRIFEPFYTTKFAGRGLGLSAVLGIVRGHQGALLVKSEVGVGTSFTVLLPFATESEVSAEEPPASVAVSFQGAGTVLLADDEASIRNAARRLLMRLGFDVLLAKDGDEAVELFKENPARFVLVIMDLTMPGKTGTDTFLAIRRIKPDMRVLFMSGFSQTDVVRTFGPDAPNGFLPKPFDVEALTMAVRDAMK